MNEVTVLPTDRFLDIDRSGRMPLYFQVANRIEGAITDGTLPPGSRLENEIALGDRLGLSRPTIRRAIQELVDKGLLVRRRGIGTQVVQGRVTRNVELTSLWEDLARMGKAATTRVLVHAVEPATATVAEQLGIDQDAEVLHLRRLRSADGVPVAILENFLPSPYLDLTEEQLTDYGLYQLLRARGVSIRVARQRIGARPAQGDEARLLDVVRHAALLAMDRTAFDTSGAAVEYGHHCYRHDLYSFEVTLVDR